MNLVDNDIQYFWIFGKVMEKRIASEANVEVLQSASVFDLAWLLTIRADVLPQKDIHLWNRIIQRVCFFYAQELGIIFI